MRIFFVQPGSAEDNNQYPPVGICYLAAAVRKHGHSVDLYDASAIGCSLPKALEVLKEFQPDVLCLSLYTIGLIDQYRFLSSVKALIPECTVVIGGPHATSLPLYTMHECSYIDYLVFGEGERTLVELIDRIDSNSEVGSIRGVCYRKDGNIRQNLPRGLTRDLDELSFPAYDLIVARGFQYAHRNFNLTNKVGVIMSSRGCPFHCAFCFKATFGNRLRRRSPQNVVAEMLWQINQFGVMEFQFLDDLFAINSKWLDEFFKELDKHHVRVPWKSLSRVNSVKREDLVKMQQHGCYGVEFGVESGNDEILKSTNKGITTSQVRDVFRTCKDIGLLTFGFFIFGLEKDNHQTIKQTCSFAIEISPDLCGFAVLLPFPGTQIYEKLPQHLRYKWSVFNSYYDKKALPLSLCDVSPHELRKYSQQANDEVNGSFSYLVKNIIFKRGGYKIHRRVAFNCWYNSYKKLFLRSLKGERVFGRHNIVKDYSHILSGSIIISIVGLFLVLPYKIFRQIMSSE